MTTQHDERLVDSLAERLRARARYLWLVGDTASSDIMGEAADKIDTLMAELRRYRTAEARIIAAYVCDHGYARGQCLEGCPLYVF